MANPKEIPSGIDRRTFLRLAGGTAFALFSSAACAPQSPVPTIDRRNTTSTAAKPTITPTTPTPEPEVTKYYPELKNYRVLSKGEFNTDRTHTKWFNLSRMSLNPDITLVTYKFFEELGKNQRIIRYPDANQGIPIGLNPKPRTERVLFFIPQDTPSPDWPNISYTATTTGRFTDGPYVTFVRVPESIKDLAPSTVFVTPETAANKSFTVEACQSSIQISSSTPEMANLGQEIICNSYGAAFALKQTGKTFDQYQPWAKDVLIRQDPKSPSYPLYILSEQEYNEIPKVGQPLK